MTIAKGRKIKVGEETFVWRLSRAASRYNGASGKTANFAAQHGSRGSMLLVKLVSRRWTPEHDWDDDLQYRHKVSFTPEDARLAILKAVKVGWAPQDKGKPFTLKNVDFSDYRC